MGLAYVHTLEWLKSGSMYVNMPVSLVVSGKQQAPRFSRLFCFSQRSGIFGSGEGPSSENNNTKNQNECHTAFVYRIILFTAFVYRVPFEFLHLLLLLLVLGGRERTVQLLMEAAPTPPRGIQIQSRGSASSKRGRGFLINPRRENHTHIPWHCWGPLYPLPVT